MKKLIIFLSVFLFTEQAQAQKKENFYLTPVTIDNSVTVSMPKEFTRTTNGGQETISANGTFGSMMVVRSQNPANSKVVKNEKGLNNVFEEYVKKVQSSLTKGTIINQHNTIVGKLEMCDFILQVDTGSGLQSRHFRLLYTTNTSYTFEYLYDDFRKDLSTPEMNTFFQSIKTAPDLDRADQYVISTQNDRPLIVELLLYVLLPITIIIAAIVYFRRKPAY
jgi:hypothetical protein